MTLVHLLPDKLTVKGKMTICMYVHVLVVYLFQSILNITYIQMNEYHCNFTHKHVLVVVYYKRRNDNYNIEFIKYSYEMVNTNNRDRDRLIKRNPISNHYSSSSSRFF